MMVTYFLPMGVLHAEPDAIFKGRSFCDAWAGRFQRELWCVSQFPCVRMKRTRRKLTRGVCRGDAADDAVYVASGAACDL